MNWDRVEGQWKQKRGKAVHHWGRLMNDELAAIAGKHEQLVGILQERYGIAKEEARNHVDEFKRIVGLLKQSNAKLLRLKKESPKKKTSRPVKRTVRAASKKRKAS